MANKAAGKGKDKKGAVKARHASQRFKLYTIAGTEVKRKNKFCPKCGVGIFMAEHKNRSTCGKCGFTEFKTK